jgi:hypothetical protein
MGTILRDTTAHYRHSLADRIQKGLGLFLLTSSAMQIVFEAKEVAEVPLESKGKIGWDLSKAKVITFLTSSLQSSTSEDKGRGEIIAMRLPMCIPADSTVFDFGLQNLSAHPLTNIKLFVYT